MGLTAEGMSSQLIWAEYSKITLRAKILYRVRIFGRPTIKPMLLSNLNHYKSQVIYPCVNNSLFQHLYSLYMTQSLGIVT